MITNESERLSGLVPSANAMGPAGNSSEGDEQGNRKTSKLLVAENRTARGRRKCFLLLTTYTILAIVMFELVFVNPCLRPVEAGKKKKMMKKIKEMLPLIALLKRKKIVLLPIPM